MMSMAQKEILLTLLCVLTAGSSVWLTVRKYKCEKLLQNKRRAILLILGILAGSAVCGWFLPLRVDNVPGIVRVLLILFCFTGSALTDLNDRKIPNLFPLIELIGFAGIMILQYLMTGKQMFRSFLFGGFLGAALTFVFFWIVRLIAKGGLGFGDIKLLTCMALNIGIYGTIYTLVIAEVSALIICIVLLAGKKATMKDTVPFAPFFLVGFLVTVCLGLL